MKIDRDALVGCRELQTRVSSKQNKAEKENFSGDSVKDSLDIGRNKDITPLPPKKWTILHYGAADNDLKPNTAKNVNQMEEVGSNKYMNIVVQLDRGGKSCKRFYIKADKDFKKITSPILEKMGDVNMSDPKTLSDFIKFGIKNFPAQHYALIIADHGEAWLGAIQDYSQKGWMSTPGIKKALETAKKETGETLDLLAFDACNMASTEVAYELKDQAKYLVGSEEIEGAGGIHYDTLLNTGKGDVLQSKIDSPRNFAKRIVESVSLLEPHGLCDYNYIPTMSAIDLSKMEDVAKASDKLAEAILSAKDDKKTLRGIVRKSQKFDNRHRDQYHIAELIFESDGIKDSKLKKSAEQLMKSIKKAVIKNHNLTTHFGDYSDAHGLNVSVQFNFKRLLDYIDKDIKKSYSELDFEKDTKWGEAMRYLLNP
jgi:hypothetical protein